jgi:hypothetical protein
VIGLGHLTLDGLKVSHKARRYAQPTTDRQHLAAIWCFIEVGISVAAGRIRKTRSGGGSGQTGCWVPVLAQNCGDIEKAATSSSRPRPLGWHGYDPVRSRSVFEVEASLELELVALPHRVIVLRRQRPHRLRLLSADRLLWVWLM